MPSLHEEMNIQDLEEVILEVPGQVTSIFQDLVLAQQVRLQEGTIKQLRTIHDRVKAALAHFGVNTNVHASQSEINEEEMRRRRPPGFQTKARREEMLHKQNIIDTVHEFVQISIRRETVTH
ncbi:uncharacterized protein LOC117291664 [Asterias rubens]|uniref:uncharacterized protein LOC117291664 n=1 Tax=Asterias rubens TaxID=7604 RepID=UPI001455AF83|nr:uncharacterized protein LOC117291664 [Asterias rubens]